MYNKTMIKDTIQAQQYRLSMTGKWGGGEIITYKKYNNPMYSRKNRSTTYRYTYYK